MANDTSSVFQALQTAWASAICLRMRLLCTEASIVNVSVGVQSFHRNSHRYTEPSFSDKLMRRIREEIPTSHNWTALSYIFGWMYGTSNERSQLHLAKHWAPSIYGHGSHTVVANLVGPVVSFIDEVVRFHGRLVSASNSSVHLGEEMSMPRSEASSKPGSRSRSQHAKHNMAHELSTGFVGSRVLIQTWATEAKYMLALRSEAGLLARAAGMDMHILNMGEPMSTGLKHGERTGVRRQDGIHYGEVGRLWKAQIFINFLWALDA